MRYLLAGVLVLGAAGVGRVDGGPIRVGMTISEVDKVLGRAIGGFSYGNFGSGGFIFYDRIDWLGGDEDWAVDVGPDDRVTNYRMNYHPFFTRPPWLNPFLNAFTPPQK